MDRGREFGRDEYSRRQGRYEGNDYGRGEARGYQGRGSERQNESDFGRGRRRDEAYDHPYYLEGGDFEEQGWGGTQDFETRKPRYYGEDFDTESETRGRFGRGSQVVGREYQGGQFQGGQFQGGIYRGQSSQFRGGQFRGGQYQGGQYQGGQSQQSWPYQGWQTQGWPYQTPYQTGQYPAWPVQTGLYWGGPYQGTQQQTPGHMGMMQEDQGYLGGGRNRQTSMYGSGFEDQYQTSSSHHGKGPRGYQRSDERIKEDVSETLTAHPGIDATDINVEVERGTVMLTGTVTERFMKRMAEDAIEHVSGVKDVQNQIKVNDREEGTHSIGRGTTGKTGQTGITGIPSRTGKDTENEREKERVRH